MITTFKFPKTAQDVITEINNQQYRSYTDAQKQEALAVIEHTQSVSLKILSDGDIKREIRKDLAKDYQILVEATKILNCPEELDNLERKATLTAWAILGVCGLIYYFLIA